jgi:hypothetical protein
MPPGRPLRTEPKPKPRICIDCPPPLPGRPQRPAPHPGPRCTTHDRVKRQQRSASRKAGYQKSQFNLDETRRCAIQRVQGGTCAICGPWTGYNGATRALSTDHDHSCCPGKTSCGQCVRGLLCKHCNDHIGRIRDDPRAALRQAYYLTYPPARWPQLWERHDGESQIDQWVSITLDLVRHPMQFLET